MSKRAVSEVESLNAAKVKAARKQEPSPPRKPGLPADLDLLMKDTTVSLMVKFGQASIAKKMVQDLREVTKGIVLSKISEAEATLSSADSNAAKNRDSSSSEYSTRPLQHILGYMNYYQECPEIQRIAVQTLERLAFHYGCWTNALKMAFVQGNGISILLQSMSVVSNSLEYCTIFIRLGISADSEWNIQLVNRLLDERVLSTMIRLQPFVDDEACNGGKNLIQNMDVWLANGEANGNISTAREAQARMQELEFARRWLDVRDLVYRLVNRLRYFVRQIEEMVGTERYRASIRAELPAVARWVEGLLEEFRTLHTNITGDESVTQVCYDQTERDFRDLLEHFHHRLPQR